jgi:dephospho-CoA kinase
MIKLGITGSMASGKTTAAKLMSGKKYPLFSADKVVAGLYKNQIFIKAIAKKLKINPAKKIKNQIKTLLKKDGRKIKHIESIIHPFVREKMKKFLKKKNKLLILEIPLLLESKLINYFDVIVFINTKKQLRLKRYLKKNNDKKIFNFLNKRQITPLKKSRMCNHVINNNKSLSVLKKNVKKVIKLYE